MEVRIKFFLHPSYLLFVFGCILCVCNSEKNTTIFLDLASNRYESKCSCFSNFDNGRYSCTSYPEFTGNSKFDDPVPSSYVITKVTASVQGDLYCNHSSISFGIDLHLNSEKIASLIGLHSYQCSCSCDQITNSTVFANGVPGYNYQKQNILTTTVLPGTSACFQGYKLTFSYSEPTPSPSIAPSKTSSHSKTKSPTPSISITPSHTPSSSPLPYTCCYYIGGPAGDSTCTVTSRGCNEQTGRSLMGHFPTNNCEQCFGN